MHDIPLLGWIAIAAILLITVVINAWMITLFRKRKGPHPLQRPGAESGAKFYEVLRDPFGQETRQLGELSKRVHEIEHTAADRPEQAEKDNPASS